MTIHVCVRLAIARAVRYSVSEIRSQADPWDHINNYCCCSQSADQVPDPKITFLKTCAANPGGLWSLLSKFEVNRPKNAACTAEHTEKCTSLVNYDRSII